ncbi:MAG: GntR family transcriptional regulator [Rhodothermales bacterium]
MATPLPLQPGRPRHEQVSDWLRERLTSDAFADHDQLPSESELGSLFNVSRITIRRALSTVESEGLIYRRQGLGSFKAPQKLPQGLVRLTDFAQDMERAGLQASSRVLHHASEAASAHVARALGLAPNATVVRLDRLRLGDGHPVALDRTWLPPFYAQLIDQRDLQRETIYQILEREHGIPIVRGCYRIEASLATLSEADALAIDAGAPLLLVHRTSLSEGDRPVYYQQRYYRADRVAFNLELGRTAHSPSSDAGMPLQELEPVFFPTS